MNRVKNYFSRNLECLQSLLPGSQLNPCVTEHFCEQCIQVPYVHWKSFIVDGSLDEVAIRCEGRLYAWLCDEFLVLKHLRDLKQVFKEDKTLLRDPAVIKTVVEGLKELLCKIKLSIPTEEEEEDFDFDSMTTDELVARLNAKDHKEHELGHYEVDRCIKLCNTIADMCSAHIAHMRTTHTWYPS
jgi:hypothetical protein